MSIAINIVEIAESFAMEKNAAKVLSVSVDIGDFSGVLADSVLFCYEACSKGKVTEGSELKINRIVAEAKCYDCGEEFVPDNRIFICPKCEGLSVTLFKGEELKVREMEIE